MTALLLRYKRRRSDGEVYTRGGAPVEVALKKNIIHLHYDMLLTSEQIAPLIVSPRCEGSVHVGE